MLVLFLLELLPNTSGFHDDEPERKLLYQHLRCLLKIRMISESINSNGNTELHFMNGRTKAKIQ